MSQRYNFRHRWLAVLFACLALLNCSLSSLALEEGKPAFSHQIWRSEDGLPGTAVGAVLQSPEGFLWTATPEGIARFDGNQFVQVLASRVEDDQGESQIALTQSRDGSLWGCASNGLARINSDKTTIYSRKDGLPGRVLTVFEDKSGVIWIGCTNGLAQFRGSGRIKSCPSQLGNLETAVRAIVQDKSGTLWFGTARGLIEFKNGHSTLHSRDDRLRDNVRSLLVSRDGGLWVGCGDGLGFFKDGAWRSLPPSLLIPQGTVVHALYKGTSDTLWIGSSHGILRFSGGSISAPVISSQSSMGTVPGTGYAFCRGREGELWIGTSVGLSCLQTTEFSIFDQSGGLPEKATTSVLQTRDGSVWMGTQNGWLSRSYNGKLTNWQVADNAITALYEDRQGTLWIGTENEGAFALKEADIKVNNTISAFSHYSAGQKGLPNNVRNIYEDHQGTLWFGGSNGLCQFRGGKFSQAPNLGQIQVITEDFSSNLWIGSHTALTCVSNGQFHTFKKLPSVPRTGISALCAEQDGVLWIGCENGDLLRYKKGIFQRGGLSSDLFERILHLSKDNAGNLWIVARNGIFRASTKQLDAFAETGGGFVDCIKLNGTQRDQFLGTGQNCVQMTRDGRMWFAGTPGTIVVDPSSLGPKSPPAVTIEEVLFENQPASSGAWLVKHNANLSSLEIHYGAFSLQSPGNMLFNCQLIGKEGWRDMGGRRVIRYDDLPIGSYTFQVTARNGQGVWNSEGAFFTFRVVQPFYRSYFFYVGALIVLIGIIFLAARIRVRQLRHRHEELLRLVEERTRSLQQEIAERKRAEQALRESQNMVFRQERLAAVGQLAAGVAHEFNNILTVIQGHTALLLENPNLSTDDTQSLMDISTSVERSARLTQQMLAFSRKQVMQRQPMDINESLRQITRMLDRALGENITFRCDFAPTLPLINADASMIGQILMNLSVNARDAMSGGGSLVIATAACTFAQGDLIGHPERRIGPFVCLSTSDTGCGMDEKTLKHIFEPFFTTKEIGKGTGLGLATVYGLVSQHQGWIEVTSQPGKGTTFKVYFPVDEKV
jgi:signal transduction histidine kinase/ligand-binding sensor domain-containing protein